MWLNLIQVVAWHCRKQAVNKDTKQQQAPIPGTAVTLLFNHVSGWCTLGKTHMASAHGPCKGSVDAAYPTIITQVAIYHRDVTKFEFDNVQTSYIIGRFEIRRIVKIHFGRMRILGKATFVT